MDSHYKKPSLSQGFQTDPVNAMGECARKHDGNFQAIPGICRRFSSLTGERGPLPGDPIKDFGPLYLFSQQNLLPQE